ncbi:hypothetical protein U1Q18_025243, partial [Sarracenia purpurea var. burkii]
SHLPIAPSSIPFLTPIPPSSPISITLSGFQAPKVHKEGSIHPLCRSTDRSLPSSLNFDVYSASSESADRADHETEAAATARAAFEPSTAIHVDEAAVWGLSPVYSLLRRPRTEGTRGYCGQISGNYLYVYTSVHGTVFEF